MDAIELGRRRAERLHADAVASGGDPTRPYTFARAEAARREVEVERVPAGDLRLYGGRALYDPDALLILHEDAGDDFLNAFLVAHELGHVDLGGHSERSTAAAIDPLRPAEPVPTGVDRVVDYSRRQRREVQMDLFAREFLLPRPWLRMLHVVEGLSASAISALVGAPHAVVAQQLLDALLLPQVEPSAGDTPARPLAPDQATAAAHAGTPFLLEAGPGTGKTQTLVGRVEHLLGRGVDPEKILILTFSNKAAGELAERIAAKHPSAAAAIWTGTFHGFGLDVIRRFHDLLGLPANPRLIDRTDAVGLLEGEYAKFNLTHFKNLWDPAEALGRVLAAISRASDEVVDAAGYRACAEAMLASACGGEECEAAERCLEVAAVFAAYERLKADRGLVDFGDLVALPVRLCESHPDVRGHLAACYGHVLVDEYQDVNRASVRLLRAVTGDGENLWAVGDVKQSIYRFRGASSYNVARFGHEDFPGAARGRLTTNYRSREEVVGAFLAFAAGMPSVRGEEVALIAHRGRCGRVPEYRAVGSAEDEVAAVAEAIEELRAEGYPYRDQAVLSAGNDRLGRLAAGLERLNIPVLYLGSLFEREEVKDLLSILSLLADGRAMGLVRIAATGPHPVPLADVALALSHLKDHDGEPLAWVSAVDSIPGLSPDGSEGLRRIASLVAGFRADADPWDVLSAVLLDRTRDAARLAGSSDVRDRARGIAIWQLMGFIRSQPQGPGYPATRLLERIRRLVLHADERDLRQLPASAQGIDAVRLLTMHGSKGLEFPVVHIPGLATNSLPRSPNAALARVIAPPDGLIEGAGGKSADALASGASEEYECLFFVALSRAKDRLLLYSPTKTSDGRSRARSPFVDRLGDRVALGQATPTRRLPPTEETGPVQLTIEGTLTVTDGQLALYERCPRRFFYTHVLKIGGRRTETAFMRMHAAVQKVVDAVAARHASMPAPGELEAALDEAWAAHGPADHGYADDYKRIASQLLRFLVASVEGLETRPVPELRMPVPGGEVVIRPDQVVSDPTGKVTMRRVRTGHRSSDQEDGLAAAAFHIAATAHTPGCTVAFVHLSDAEVTPVALTERVLANRQAALNAVAEGVRAGRFPLNVSPACPRCPAFYICGRLPAGPLATKFSP